MQMDIGFGRTNESDYHLITGNSHQNTLTDSEQEWEKEERERKLQEVVQKKRRKTTQSNHEKRKENYRKL